MRRPKERLIAGIDLHGNNVVMGVINQDGKRVAYRKADCDLTQVVEFLKPLKPQLQSMAVESTFNWYWLVAGVLGELLWARQVGLLANLRTEIHRLRAEAGFFVDAEIERFILSQVGE